MSEATEIFKKFNKDKNGRYFDDCDATFGFGSVIVYCDKLKGHKGKHQFKTDNMEIKWRNGKL